MDQPRALIAAALLAACDEIDDGPVLATEVVAAPGATGEGFGDAERAVNGVRGGGRWEGSTDVFSLGLNVGDDDSLVLGFADDRMAIDVEGPDLAVFENAFEVEGGGFFLDPVVVEVSADCDTWVAFPHIYTASDPMVYEPDPDLWVGFAGLGPVLLHEEEHAVDPLSAEAGGDRFDFADLESFVGARCVRLRSATEFPSDPVSNGADIDGVYAAAVH